MIHLKPPSHKQPPVPHEFIKDGHLYKVEGEFVLSTSDVIEFNGLSDVSMLPQDFLDYAGHRGTAVHLAVRSFEERRTYEETILAYQRLHQVKPPARSKHSSFFDDCMERMAGYMRWRAGKEVALAVPMEQSRVYRHVGTEHLIGGTMDMVAFVDGKLYIIDLKTCHKQSGKKLRQLLLKWKLQTESYKEAGEAEGGIFHDHEIKRAVLHLHPQCGKVGIRGEERGFEWHEFNGDDSFLWDSAIRMAMAKMTHGWELARRTEVIEKADLEQSQGKYKQEDEQGVTDADIEWWWKSTAPVETSKRDGPEHLREALRASLAKEG